MKTVSWRALAAAGMIAVGLCFVLGVYSFGLTDKATTERDYIQYWAAGQQVAHGANPYDIAAILRVEQAAGLDGNSPKVTLSPPPILLLAFPLGFVGAKTGIILWMLVVLCALLASILLIWRLNGSPPSGYHWLGMAYPPAIACLMTGQISAFLLLGVVLFFYWHESKPWLAGAVLVPCVLKPHLFLAVALVLLMWVVSRRAYRILAGFATALIACCALTTCLDRHAWSEYARLSHANSVIHLRLPTLSSNFRFLVDANAVWLQFLPAALSCVWAVWYFRTRRARWNWLDHGLLVMLVAAVCAPYAFFFDETVLLPAVLAGVYRAAGARRSLLPLILIFAAALIETCSEVRLISWFYLWTTPAWLAWYLYATRNKNTSAQEARAS